MDFLCEPRFIRESPGDSGVSWNKEYYTLDGMLYEERGMDETGKHATYANWISVAIEHEKDVSRAREKMNKLQSFNAPLKVLITYAAEGPASETLLRRYENLIKTSDVFHDVATLRQQLVIFGRPRPFLNGDSTPTKTTVSF